MTAKSRVRKTMKKIRRSTDVKPYTVVPRKPSDGTEEARVEAVVQGRIRIEGSRVDEVAFVRDHKGGYIIEVGGEEGLRAQASLDSASGGKSGSPSIARRTAVAAHLAVFEAEVNGQPTHIDWHDCQCDISTNHWQELGAN